MRSWLICTVAVALTGLLTAGFTVVVNGHRIPGPDPSKVGDYRVLKTEPIRQGQRLAVKAYVLFPQTLTHDQLGPTAMQAALDQASKFNAGWVELRALAAEGCVGKGSQVAVAWFSNDGKGATPTYNAPTWEVEIVPENCWPWSDGEIAAAEYYCKNNKSDGKPDWIRRSDKFFSCVPSVDLSD